MTPITSEMVADALASHNLAEQTPVRLHKLAGFGNLILRWSQRISLTAIRDAQGILERHVVECVAAAEHLPKSISTLLDYGSGAGLPGIPMAIIRDEIRVTLAEAQGRKVAFLREAARTLDLQVTIHAGRVTELEGPALFDGVALRAVDKMEASVREARERVATGGYLLLFATEATRSKLVVAANSASIVEHSLPMGCLLVCQF